MPLASHLALRHGSLGYAWCLKPSRCLGGIHARHLIPRNPWQTSIVIQRPPPSSRFRTDAWPHSRRLGYPEKGSAQSEPRLRYTEVDEHGSITQSVSSSRSELLAKYGLAPRDIRKIDSSTLSHILIRPTTVLLHLFHLKVLVQRNRVLLFDSFQSSPDASSTVSPASRSALLRDLQDRIRQPTNGNQPQTNDDASSAQLPYEFRALEAVFGCVVTELERELYTIKGPALQLLKSLEEEVDSGLDRRKLHILLNLHNQLSRFAQQAELVRTAVEDVLDYEDSMAALYLTDKSEGRARATFDDLTTVELLLDSYYRLFDEIAQEAQNLVVTIRNTEESVSAILDANRNLLMLLDLKFRMGTLGLAVGSFFSAFYGMNIMSHIREYLWAFPGVSVTSAFLAIATTCYGMLVLRKFVRLRLSGRGDAAAAGRKVR
ncbi:hypothetical protein PspLS_00702 [Pyricularia sp. CBS 133598]|nr:hypothetical protein PspLS_00702 [Pyricularia sp. CBS 133598]